MNASHPSAHGGFTLLEMLISLVIGLIAIAVGLGIFIGQNISFQKQSGIGSAVNQSQVGADALYNAVRLAGTGIDPAMAFDFDFYNCQLPGTGLNMTESANCAATKRDAIDGPDELVVAYRDPAYSTTWTNGAVGGDTRVGCTAGDISYFVGKIWGVTAANASSVTLVMKPGDVFYRGQVLQIACDDGISYTYATVSSGKTSVPVSSTTCNSVTLSLYPAVANDPFNQPGFLTSACFSGGNARAYAVKRQRFFIHRDLSGTTRPYLMMDLGLDLDDDGKLTDADLQPIAADIEDLQFAYALDQVGILTLATPPTGWTTATYVTDNDKNGVWGDTSGAQEQLSEPLTAGSSTTTQFNAANATIPGAGSGLRCTAYATNTFYQYPCLWGSAPLETSQANSIFAYRWVAWPGNIASVQIGIIARLPASFGASSTGSGVTNDSLNIPALLNRPTANLGSYPAWYGAINPAGFKRVTTLTSVRPVNMSSTVLYWN